MADGKKYRATLKQMFRERAGGLQALQSSPSRGLLRSELGRNLGQRIKAKEITRTRLSTKPTWQSPTRGGVKGFTAGQLEGSIFFTGLEPPGGRLKVPKRKRF